MLLCNKYYAIVNLKVRLIPLSNLIINNNSNRASDIVKKYLYENNGRTTVSSARGKNYVVSAHVDGVHFECKELPIKPPYEYSVFDIIVDCIIKNGGEARKGNARNYRLGEKQCDKTTLVGYIGQHYFGKNIGDSVYDPVFVLVPILQAVGIVENNRGIVTFTDSYINMCGFDF